MLSTLKLLLPALVPSWRFFDRIGPSPRIEVSVGGAPWRAYRPRPEHVGCVSMARRLFWNPEWNETLFLVSCATRLIEDEDERAGRWIAEILSEDASLKGTAFRFRVVLVTRDDRRIVYVSPGDAAVAVPR